MYMCVHVWVHVWAGTYVSAHVCVYSCFWRLAESLEYCSLGTIHLGVFGQGLSLAGNSPTRLGCLAKKSQQSIFTSPVLGT